MSAVIDRSWRDPDLLAKALPAALLQTTCFLAPLLMIAGFWTRPAAAIVAATMLAALVLGHPRELVEMTAHGGLLLEVQWMFFLGSVASAFLGAGRYSLGGRDGRWN